MGQQGSSKSRSNTIDRVEEAVLKGVTSTGEEVFFEVDDNGELQTVQEAENGARLTDLLATVGTDEARFRLFGEDNTDTLVEANLAALSDSPADADVSILTYLSRALNSKDLDEFVTRVTDSAGTQVDPATAALENALKSSDTDEFVTRITDTAGAEVDPATAALEAALKSNDADEFVARITDTTGAEIDPLTDAVTASVAGDEVRVDLQASGVQLPVDQQDALEKSSVNYGTDIETDTEVVLQIDGYATGEVYFNNADTATDLSIEKSWDGNNYEPLDSATGVNAYEATYTDETAKYLRLTITGTGTAEDTADAIVASTP